MAQLLEIYSVGGKSHRMKKEGPCVLVLQKETEGSSHRTIVFLIKTQLQQLRPKVISSSRIRVKKGH